MKRESKSSGRKPRRPATTPEGRENQLVSLAFDLVEQKLMDGTASSQEVIHFLRLGSTRGKLEEKRIENENLLLSAKVDALASAKKVEELISDALKAMRVYTGQEPANTEFEEFETFDELG